MSLINYIFGIAMAQAQAVNNVDQVASNTGSELTKLIGNFFASIPLWIAAIVVGFFSYMLAVMVKKALETKLSEQGIEEEHKEVKIVAGRSAFFGVLIIGITVSLSIVGIDLKPIVAAGAFGLGFALQDIIMNLISGMFILASHHYTIGDTISIGSVVGKIEEIQTRATIIKAFDGTKVIVPNSELFSNVVISKTSNPYRKMTFAMGVGYGSNLKEVMELTLAVVKSIPWVLRKPKPSVIFNEWGDSTINFNINVWIDSKGGKFVKVKNRVMMDLTQAYSDAGFDIPYPIQTIQMDKGDEAEVNHAEITQKVNALKAKYKAKSTDTTYSAQILPQILTPALATETAGDFSSGLTVPSTQIVEATGAAMPTASTATAPVIPVQQALPVAIQTTPNSPGQGWLQQALQQQVTATVNTVPQSVTQVSPVSLPVTATPVSPVSLPATVIQGAVTDANTPTIPSAASPEPEIHPEVTVQPQVPINPTTPGPTITI